MWQRFTEHARQAILLAQEEAQSLGSDHVGTEHLLLGLLREPESSALGVLNASGVSAESVREAILAQVTAREGGFPEPKLTPKTKRLLELAADEARRMRRNYIGTEHLLLAILREKGGLAASALRQLGVELEKARGEVRKSLGLETGPATERIESGDFSFAVDRLTDQAKLLLGLAAVEANRLGHGHIGTEHILLALLAEQKNAATVLLQGSVHIEGLRAQILARIDRRGAQNEDG